jgi:thiosulfate/3-mercaptopyruvate sulfurtransferase
MTDIPTSGLVSPDVLAGALGSPDLVVIDIRSTAEGGRQAFELGHVPGAAHSDYAADRWRAKVGNAPGMLPPLDHLAELAGQLGIRPASKVVIVPAGLSATDLAAAARVYWTLKLIGHGQQAILHGGFKAWQTDPRRPVATGPATAKAAPPYPVVMQQKLRSTADATLVASKGKLATLVDARSAGYFEGREKAAEAARAGHIPGAVSRDYAEAFDPAAGRLKPAGDLAALFGSVPKGPAISYCNTGHTAALNWFVLSEVLGREEISLYDGSMTDWTQDPERPVATGAA